tara:strand:+ start:558 stop:920 length:363 start_codon:yes stop_codon:yes gene_type:complete
MSKLLVHIITGVENPSRAVLGFAVAKAALHDGHDVTVFCAGDGVSSLHEITTTEMQGVGLGKLSDYLTTLKNEGASLYASKMSAKARGISPDQLESLGFKPATPNKLVELCFDNDRTLVY